MLPDGGSGPVGMLALAVVLDQLIGDPAGRWHPVVLIGRSISRGEAWLLRLGHSSRRQQGAGAVLVGGVLALAYGGAWAWMQLLAAAGWAATFLGGALLLSFTISPRSLAAAGGEIRDFLAQGNLAEARRKVGWIVGRDTAELDEGEITRATVETVAENIVDGIIAPLFYFLLGGVPLAMLYRAVNTLDSMVGYRNARYEHFGKAAARTDDVFNWLPARLTALLLIGASWALRLDWRGAWAMMRRDAASHPSPNSGYAEATVAGALGVQLGGLNYYGGVASHRAKMGEPRQALAGPHITQTVRLMRLTVALFLLLASLLLEW